MARAKSGDEKITKRKMVEIALAEAGDVKAAALQSFILEKFGAELKTSIISSYKSQINSKNSTGGGKRGRKKGSVSAGNAGSFSIKDLEDVKAMISRVGADNLNQMIKILS